MTAAHRHLRTEALTAAGGDLRVARRLLFARWWWQLQYGLPAGRRVIPAPWIEEADEHGVPAR